MSPRSLAAPLVLLLAAGCASSAARYPTPDAAVAALAQAVRSDSTEQLVQLFGADAAELLSSGDDVADRNQRARFLELYQQGHHLAHEEPGSATLIIGPDDWPFPVPVVQERNGAWAFDSEAGLEEIVNRRIGRNELDTIETCRAIVDAQREYAALNLPGKPAGQYARRFLSQPGASAAGVRDALYWPTQPGEPPSPLGALVADAQAEGYSLPESGATRPYHGYVYRMLTAQGAFAPGGRRSYLVDERLTGGFAVVAYPVEYGNSGMMTFIVNANGFVYESDLGDDTARIAGTMTEFDPGPSWFVSE